LDVSATNTDPLGSTTMPVGRKNRAAVPTSSTAPLRPGDPARVETVPVVEMTRIV
jgi:hypothetical protein